MAEGIDVNASENLNKRLVPRNNCVFRQIFAHGGFWLATLEEYISRFFGLVRAHRASAAAASDDFFVGLN